ncbi:hypothetical protein [Streptomyces sp. NPDC051677]|uniref:hypothetical protein n=1 Tax=Streptomyces sp. NPDC051677 TaxID=3365669 RepID=UPI0037D08164
MTGDLEAVGRVGLAGGAEDEAGADVWVGVPDGGPGGALPDEPSAADPPPPDVLHAARTATAAIM